MNLAKSIFLIILGIFVGGGATAEVDEHRAIDVVICLDTSGSMKDLLDSARARIWDVVGELGRLQPFPELRVGLVTYGTISGTADEGWVLVRNDLTNDLDAVYAELMSLEIGGTDELVGHAIHTAVETMAWSPYDDALKVIFITGNEPSDQGEEGLYEDSYSLRDAAERARDEGILINAIYAGPRDQAVAEGWDVIAREGRGNFSSIDPSSSLIQIPTPQDEALLELNDRLNLTYVPFGPRGRDGFVNQVAQDMNASRLGVESCSSRIVAKGSALYTNASWDLVDASLDEDFRWARLRDEDLPEEMRGMTLPERASYVAGKRAEREAIQTAIQEKSAEREAFLREKLESGESRLGLGDAMREAIRAQAAAKGFTASESVVAP